MRYLFNSLSCLLLACCAFVCIMHAQADTGVIGNYDVELGSTFISATTAHSPQLVVEQENNIAPRKDQQVLPQHRHNKKPKSGQFLPYKISISQTGMIPSSFDAEVTVLNPIIPESYQYLFFKEINPPPPKAFSC